MTVSAGVQLPILSWNSSWIRLSPMSTKKTGSQKSHRSGCRKGTGLLFPPSQSITMGKTIQIMTKRSVTMFINDSAMLIWRFRGSSGSWATVHAREPCAGKPSGFSPERSRSTNTRVTQNKICIPTLNAPPAASPNAFTKSRGSLVRVRTNVTMAKIGSAVKRTRWRTFI